MIPLATRTMLAAWIGIGCPVLCGLHAGAGDDATSVADCCRHDCSPSETPHDPATPPKSPAGSCFCDANGVLLAKVHFENELFLVSIAISAAGGISPDTTPALRALGNDDAAPTSLLAPGGSLPLLI